MMVTSRTPLRVSFFGGGTDYPEYFARHPGAVVGMAINKYIYISALKLQDFIDYRYRLSYSRLERVRAVEEIEHPVVRSVLHHYGVDDPLDISIMADLPASSGLGSSSAFTVGFVNLVSALRARAMTRLDLGKAAIHVERELLQERVGVQDQLHAAFGGMNRFDFIDGRIRITPVQMSYACQRHLMGSLVLVYTGVTRFASDVLEEQLNATRAKQKDAELTALMALTNEAVGVLEGRDPDALVTAFGAMMHESWQIKRQLAASITTPAIDALYERARQAGALGGKLCGAGGGGFLLMVVPAERMDDFIARMAPTPSVMIDMDMGGSTILNS